MTGARRLVATVGLALSAPLWAGTYIFADSGDPTGADDDVVTHPIGYRGFNNQSLTLDVCIAPGSPSAAATSVRNAIDRFNLLVPTVGNLKQGVSLPGGGVVDFESVLVHEMGHCLGLAHVNLASESELPNQDDWNYTKATNGRNNIFELLIGQDNVRGSPDDQRGDDSNLHYFFIGDNNPFTLPAAPDSSNYSRDVNDLPSGDLWVANGDRTVAALSRYGVPNTEAVMQQGTGSNEVQRALTADDVATLLYARTGVDHVADTVDDYAVILNYAGFSGSSSCELQIEFEPDTFAFCEAGADDINSSNVRMTSARLVFDEDLAWAYETRRIPLPAVDNIEVPTGGSTSAVSGGATTLTANDTNQNGGSLRVATESVFGPDHGTVDINSNGTFSYSHNGNSATEDRFVYEVCSGSNTFACAHQYVNVTIEPNRPPSPGADAIEVDEGATVTVLDGGADSVLDNDSDPDGDTIVVEQVTTPPQFAAAFAVNASGTFSYTHDASQNLSDSFVYQVCDDFEPPACAEQTVSISVANINDPPIIDGPDPVLVTMSEDGLPTPFALNLNAADDDGDPLDWSTPALTAAGASAAVSPSGIVSYTPTADFFGADTVLVTVTDGELSDTVSVDVTVDPINDPPSFSASNPPDVLSTAGAQILADWVESAAAGPANEADQTLSYSIGTVSDPQNVVLIGPTVADDGTLSYTPGGNAGSASFELRAVDSGDGDNSSPSQLFFITVIADEPPQPVQAGPFSAQAPVTVGSAVGDLDFTDGNGGGVDQGISYSVTGGSGQALFTLAADGSITANTDLAAVIGQTLTLEVEVSEASQSIAVTVQIEVVERPLFADGFEA